MKEQKIEKVYDGNNLLAIVLRNGDYTEGVNFINDENDYIQVGTWNYDKGKLLKAHRHNVFKRIAKRTQEVVYVKSGKMKSNIYNEQDNLLTEIGLETGDIIIYLAGGHDFEILEDNTQVFEVKNGPYFGLEVDKHII